MFHYITGGLAALCGCFPIIHLAVGIAILAGALKDSSGEATPTIIGVMFVVFPAIFMILAWALAIGVLISGRRLALRRSYMYCFVIACIECLFMPIGTILGVFTIIVLMRPSVKQIFGVDDESSTAASAAP